MTTNSPNDFSGYSAEGASPGGYPHDRTQMYGPPQGYGPEYSVGSTGQWQTNSSPARPTRNRLWYVLGGLTALALIGCIGLTALGIIVGKDERIQANSVSANQAAAPAAPGPTQVASTTPATEATTAPAAPASTVATTPPPTAVPAATTAVPDAPATLPEVELPPTEEAVAPAKIKMPRLAGRNAAEADDVLRKLGFTNVTYGSADRYDTVVIMLPNWTVKKQSVKSGAKILPDTMIVLTCTKQ